MNKLTQLLLWGYCFSLFHLPTVFAQNNNCAHPDYAALAALYQAADGDNWTTSWDLSNCDVCSYDGITCNGNDRVEKIRLSENNLSGSIPLEIKALSQLTLLNLSRNKLTTTIPSSIGNLSLLRILILSGNQLTGDIPKTIGDLSELVDLRLDFNQLTGSIPDEMGNLTNIVHLALGDNQLTGSIPATLGNLVHANRLILINNQLSGSLPLALSHFGSQRDASISGGINLENNQITGCFPASFTVFCSENFTLLTDGNENLNNFATFCATRESTCETATNCDRLIFSTEAAQIKISNLTPSSKVEIISENTNYRVLSICGSDNNRSCSETQWIPNLATGTYTVKVTLAIDGNYCYREVDIFVAGDGTTNENGNCDNLLFFGEDQQITIEGLTANYSKIEIIGQPTNWRVLTICEGDCSETQIIPDLTAGDYVVKINQSENHKACYREERVSVTDGGNRNNCDNLVFSSSNDTIKVSGLTTNDNKVEIIGQATNWRVLTICEGDCAITQIIPNLKAGEYVVKVNQGENGNAYCYREAAILVENGSRNRNGAIDLDSDLVLYPNPARDRIYLQTPFIANKKGTIQVYNAFGQSTKSFSATSFEDGIFMIDLDGYENGIYLVVFRMDGLQPISRRFVVEHLR